MNDQKITLLTIEDILGTDSCKKIDAIDKYGASAAVTDLAILTGGYYVNDYTSRVPDDNSLRGRPGLYYTKSADFGDVITIKKDELNWSFKYTRKGTIRPVLTSSDMFSKLSPNRVKGYNGVEEVECGEYPQYAADFNMQKKLENEFKMSNLKTTGKNYTFDKTSYKEYSQCFQPVIYEEYLYQGKKYIRVQVESNPVGYILSNSVEYNKGDYVWVEVSPIKWLIDDSKKILISKRGLLSGVRFQDCDKPYDGDFSKTEMYEYLNKYMLRDLIPSQTLKKAKSKALEENDSSKNISQGRTLTNTNYKKCR